MKKKLMPLAVGAAIAASSAQAQMYLNNDGTGEMLVFPFYSAEAGNTTNVNIVNTTDVAKAVKVRIIEGENSQEVLDFNVYMSARDHFSFAIAATEEGGGSLVTNDNTCTVPQLTAGEAVPFRGILYAGDKGEDNKATEDKDESFDNTGIERTAVGYIEVIEMGQLNMAKADWDEDEETADSISPMLAAITHGADGVPADCTLPVAAWSSGGAWAKDAADNADTDDVAGVGETFMGVTWNGGGLYGQATVVNVADATAFGEDADAIESAVDTSIATVGYGGAQLHYPPGDTRPDFTSDGVNTSSTVAVDGEMYGMSWTDYGDDASLMAVTSIFQTQYIQNDYVTDPGIAASTDWIITHPTKFQHINGYVAAVDNPGTEDDVEEVPALEPFSVPWDGQEACEYAGFENWDREEATPLVIPDVPDFSPAPEVPKEYYDLPLCYEVNVVVFGDTSAVKNESLDIGVGPQLEDNDGWAKISLAYEDLSTSPQGGAAATVNDAQRFITDDADQLLSGLPVTGFAVQTYTNGSVNGSGNVANYAASLEHKTSAAGSDLGDNG
jgi:hypothetical protein